MHKGDTTLEVDHIREGVAIKATGEQDMQLTSMGNFIRPTLKTHCDVFLRKFGQDD